MLLQLHKLFGQKEQVTTREMYKASLEKFCEYIVDNRILHQDGIMYFNDLFKPFVETVMTVEGVDASNYNSSRLKARLKKRFPQLIFHPCGGRNKGETALKENLGARDVLCKKLGKVNI